jgi:pectin methylesterase-like acyl-CoA thioesterase
MMIASTTQIQAQVVFRVWLASGLLAAQLLSASSRAATTINVDMDHGATYSGTAAAPDLGTKWNSISGGGTLSTVLDSQGNTLSGVTITFSSSSGVFKLYNDTTSGNPNPAALMSDYTYGATYTFAVTGLIPGQAYGLYAYSHGNVDNQTGTVTLAAANGGASASTTPTGDNSNFRNTSMYGQGFNYVVLNGTADGSGNLNFTVVNFLNGFQLQRLSAPVINGLTNETVIAGTTTVLSPVINGAPPPSFQWRSNNVTLAGETNASLTLDNIQYAQNGTVYSLVASNYVGAVTNSMTLSVVVTPVISGLNNQANPTGNTVTISPTVSGVPTPALQWSHNGTNLTDGATGFGSTISGSATSTLSIANAQTADSGVYSLVASNSAGMVTNSMTLTVSSGDVAPSITGPTDQTVVQGSNATFSASVAGLPLPTVQWRVNGTDIRDATNSALTVTNVQYSQNGDVCSLVASNQAGKATNSATLYVLVPPEISQQPTNLTVTVGQPATFSVDASGVPDVSYQWLRNGTPIAGATSASYTLPGAQGVDNGAVFSVVVSNSVDVVTSGDATLTVLSTMTGTFLPTNGSVNISPDQQLRIVFSGGTPVIGYSGKKLYVYDASNNSLFATIDTSQFHTFMTDSATVSNAFVRTEQGQNFYYMPIAIYGNEAWITLNPANRFVYGKTYYVTCDTGLFLDSNGAAFPGITGTNTWRFAIKSSGPATATASTGPTNITVGLDGAGDFATLQGASDWIPQNNTLERTITILPGTYHDFAIFTQNRNHVRVIGAGLTPQDVQIIYPNAAYTSGSSCGLLRVESSDMYFRNFTLDNQVYLTNSLDNYGPWAGRLNTLDTSGKRLIFDHVIIKGGQDTLYAINGSAYYDHCEIWGSVDFIYGGALSVFNQCNIVEIRPTGGTCTAPSTPYAQPYGLVFLNCNFPRALVANGYPYDVGDATTTFMRPWGQDGMTALINCAVGEQISTMGWSTWSGRETTCRAREYGTTLIGDGAVNVPQVRWNAGAYWVDTFDPDYTNSTMSPTDPLLYGPGGTNNRVAVVINTNDYTLPAIFGNSYFGLNGWLPTVIPTITSQPASQTVQSGAMVTFTVAATGLLAPACQWMKDGTNLTGQTGDTLNLPDVQWDEAGTYSAVVSNSAGSVMSSNAYLAVVNTNSTNLVATMEGNRLQLSWPQDHLGWRLQYQTNSVDHGLGTNWMDWPDSTNVFQTNIVINPSSGSVFFRLTYP